MDNKKEKFLLNNDTNIDNLINVSNVTEYSSSEGINPLKMYVYKFGMFPNKLNFNGFSQEFLEKYPNYQLEYNINKFVKLLSNSYDDLKLNINRYCDENCNTISMYLTVFLEKEKVVAYIDTTDTTGIIVYYNEYKYGIDVYKKFIKSLVKIAPPLETKKISLIVTQVGGGYGLMDSEIKQVEVNVNKHYNDDFKKADTTIRNFINEDKTSGLVILNGVKGTGKTTYIRNLINTTSRKYIYLTKEMASALTDPSFISFLTTVKDSVLIIEDCENLVAARSQGNSSTGISNLLNMCDGLLSDVFNIKIIATFNEDINKVDSALLRKGRLIYHYEFKELDIEKTNKLFKSLKIDYTSDSPMTLADIFNYEKENGEESKKRKSIGFN